MGVVEGAALVILDPGDEATWPPPYQRVIVRKGGAWWGAQLGRHPLMWLLDGGNQVDHAMAGDLWQDAAEGPA